MSVNGNGHRDRGACYAARFSSATVRCLSRSAGLRIHLRYQAASIRPSTQTSSQNGITASRTPATSSEWSMSAIGAI